MSESTPLNSDPATTAHPAPTAPPTTSPTTSPPNPEKPRRKRHLLRWVLGSGVLLIVGLLVLVLLLPTLLSTGPGNAFVLSQINGSLPGSVQASSISLAWFSGQTLRDVELVDEKGGIFGELPLVQLEDASIWGLLTGSRDLGRVGVDVKRLDITTRDDGFTNIEHFIFTDAELLEPSKGVRIPKTLRADITLSVASATYASPELETIAVKDIQDAKIVIRRPQDIAVQLATVIEQGGERAPADIDLQLLGLFNNDGLMQPLAVMPVGTASLPRVPVSLIAAFSPEAAETLGPPSSNAVLRINTTGGTGFGGDIKLTSERTQVAVDLKGDGPPATMKTVNASIKGQTQVTPDLLAMVTATAPGKEGEATAAEPPAFTLDKPFSYAFGVDEMVLPMLENGGIDIANVSWADADSVVTGLVARDAEGESIEIPKLGIGLNTAGGLGKQITLGLKGDTRLANGEVKRLTGNVVIQQMAGAEGLNDPKAWNVKAELLNVPPPLADQLAGMGGYVTHLLGKDLNKLVIDYRGTSDGTRPFDLGLDSTNVFADVHAGIDAKFTTLSKTGDGPAVIKADPVAAAGSWLTAIFPLFAAVKAGGSDLDIRADEFSIPLDGMNLNEVTAQMSFSMEQMTIELSPEVLSMLPPEMTTLIIDGLLGGKRVFKTNLPPVAINIDNGRLAYSGLTFALGDLNLVVAGNVALDGGASTYTVGFTGPAAKSLQGLALTLNRDASGNITIPGDQLQKLAIQAGLNSALGELLPGGVPKGIPGVSDGDGENQGDGKIDHERVIGDILGGIGKGEDQKQDKAADKKQPPAGTIGQPRSDATPPPKHEEAKDDPTADLLRGVIGSVRKKAEEKEKSE